MILGNTIQICHQHYTPTLAHSRLVRDLKGEFTVSLLPSLVIPISLISTNFEPTPLLHSIYIMDYDIPDNFILVGWVVSILSTLRRILVFVDVYAYLDLQPPCICNGAVG